MFSVSVVTVLLLVDFLETTFGLMPYQFSFFVVGPFFFLRAQQKETSPPMLCRTNVKWVVLSFSQ